MKKSFLLLASIIALATSCIEQNQNLNKVGLDKFEAHAIDSMPGNLVKHDTVYIPVYSDIYSESKDTRFNLTATLSLRNTSLHYSIYISAVDYYDSEGRNTKKFLSSPIVLTPMQSVEYVIDEHDTSGGTGANFVVYWGSESEKTDPLFEGIMISTNGQQGISFTSKGVSISGK